ncbi:hypothetical protein GWR56_13800 [Mucilaginibacter sp. 14171R-50]|uniref:hypothetical protein n=1 Tax=Mucilaginibacter sp. 14171R-50 TaxID=2703789 RepID=UPI00138C713C|nr:hypothetical protein [Mucilaginibacter sp. 14171R-50]QHS56563.1 hypothetical protein GWR56_13800 [Mucilaginibacter sp. 14171R-50]
MKRYFNYHLQELTVITNAADSGIAVDHCLSIELLALIDHLWMNHSVYLDGNITAPPAYQKKYIAAIALTTGNVNAKLRAARVRGKLKDCLLNFMSGMTSAGIPKSFHDLNYFQAWLYRLSDLDFQQPEVESAIHAALESLNFNDLSYLNFRQGVYGGKALPAAEKIRYLKAEKARLMLLSETPVAPCRPGWPSLGFMLCGWLSEEIAAVEYESRQVAGNPSMPPQKVPLNLSVAHLACFLKLLCCESVPADLNLTRLFQFVAGHFSAKRQKNISARSLSKEYYSTTQVTAAKVQGMLQQMIARINRLYFPLVAWLAAGAALGFLPGR